MWAEVGADADAAAATVAVAGLRAAELCCWYYKWQYAHQLHCRPVRLRPVAPRQRDHRAATTRYGRGHGPVRARSTEHGDAPAYASA